MHGLTSETMLSGDACTTLMAQRKWVTQTDEAVCTTPAGVCKVRHREEALCMAPGGATLQTVTQRFAARLTSLSPAAGGHAGILQGWPCTGATAPVCGCCDK